MTSNGTTNKNTGRERKKCGKNVTLIIIVSFCIPSTTYTAYDLNKLLYKIGLNWLQRLEI